MQCKSWTLLAMGQAPYWLILLPYIHLSTWCHGGGWGVWPVKYCQNLEDHKNEFIHYHTPMFKRKVFPHRFIKNMHFQVKGCYGKEKVKAFAVFMDIDPRFSPAWSHLDQYP